ncbi:MAG TPA: hypothetical protein VHF22_09885 [Planctomycetota bacterium]|nr:hypothetical protein [Planctomycetota bacterium]
MRPARSASRGALFIAALAAGFAAVAPGRATVEVRLPSLPEKAASFRPFAADEVEGVPLARYLGARTVTLLGRARLRHPAAGSFRIEAEAGGNAAVIDRRLPAHRRALRRVRYATGERTSLALRPDPAWIAARIEEDRRAHPAGR